MKHYLEMGTYSYAYHAQLPLSSINVTSSGEDASVLAPRANFMGVADGVSAWSAYALGNSGFISYYLMYATKLFAEKGHQQTYGILLTSLEHIWSLYDKKSIQIPHGSTTLCVAKLMEDPTTRNIWIQYSNLGDSMILIVRPQRTDDLHATLRVIHHSMKLYSAETVNGIPVPLQLCFYPSYGRKAPLEQLQKTENHLVDVVKGDIVIIATDGLWDNLTTDSILAIIKDELSLNPHLNTKQMAVKLVDAAKLSYVKPDDITAVVGVVREQSVYT